MAETQLAPFVDQKEKKETLFQILRTQLCQIL